MDVKPDNNKIVRHFR